MKQKLTIAFSTAIFFYLYMVAAEMYYISLHHSPFTSYFWQVLMDPKVNLIEGLYTFGLFSLLVMATYGVGVLYLSEYLASKINYADTKLLFAFVLIQPVWFMASPTIYSLFLQYHTALTLNFFGDYLRLYNWFAGVVVGCVFMIIYKIFPREQSAWSRKVGATGLLFAWALCIFYLYNEKF